MIFPKITTFPLFWENGMKLSSEHFQHLENSVEDATRDVRALSLSASGGFGLLPMSPFLVRNTEGGSPQSVRVVLEACRAVLPGGYRVEILPENVQQLQLPQRFPAVEFAPTAGVRYHVFLIVNDKRRVAAGVPQARPIRHPHLSPEYALECLPQDRLSAVATLAPNRMKIAEWQNGKIVEGYIPATLTIKGFPLLEKWHQFFQNQLENIVRVGIQVIHEQRARDIVRAGFCQPIIQYIRASQGSFRWALPNMSPINLVAYYGDFAGLIESLIETSDRDFVRNQLKDGQINGLRQNIQELIKHRTVPIEEMAFMMTVMQKFGESLQLTLQNLTTYVAPAIKQGDQRITSG